MRTPDFDQGILISIYLNISYIYIHITNIISIPYIPGVFRTAYLEQNCSTDNKIAKMESAYNISHLLQIAAS